MTHWRRITLLGALLVSSVGLAQAKNYFPFRMEVGGFGAWAPGGIGGGGFGALLEPKFNLHDHIAVGLRVEGSVLFGGGLQGATITAGLRSQAAYLLKGDFFFTTTTVRPFAALGLGLYTSGGISGNSNGGGVIDAGRNFGFAPQLGVNFGRFRLAVTYHAILGGPEVTVSSGSTQRLSRNYLAFEMGGTILGSRNEQPRPPSEPDRSAPSDAGSGTQL